MKALSVFIKIISNIAAFLAVLILIAAALCLAIQLKPAVVMSGSMEPEIQTGSFVLIDKKDTDIEIGDVIAYNHQEMQVLHRVIEITEDGIITKGDNNENADMYVVTPSGVIGTLKITIPKLGYFIEWASSISGLIILTTLCVLLVLASFITDKPNTAIRSAENGASFNCFVQAFQYVRVIFES